MKLIRQVSALREALDEARLGQRTTGLVPTMGAFHEGHLSLMRRARSECDVVVVSLFVNPKQFDEPSDLEAYQRDEHRDAALARTAGVDFLFAPPVSELYPEGFATLVSVTGPGERLEGANRGPGHFAGVATIVVKLFNIVAPDVAYFGQKDAQQVAVVRRVVRDLDLPVRVAVSPTVRAADGLALSSRNVRLSIADRARATALYRALRAAEQAITAGERDPATVVAAAREQLATSGIEPEYLELVNPKTFAPARRLEGDVLAVVAASISGTRLIDNQLIRVSAGPEQSRSPARQRTTQRPVPIGAATMLAGPS